VSVSRAGECPPRTLGEAARATIGRTRRSDHPWTQTARGVGAAPLESGVPDNEVSHALTARADTKSAVTPGLTECRDAA